MADPCRPISGWCVRPSPERATRSAGPVRKDCCVEHGYPYAQVHSPPSAHSLGREPDTDAVECRKRSTVRTPASGERALGALCPRHTSAMWQPDICPHVAENVPPYLLDPIASAKHCSAKAVYVRYTAEETGSFFHHNMPALRQVDEAYVQQWLESLPREALPNHVVNDMSFQEKSPYEKVVAASSGFSTRPCRPHLWMIQRQGYPVHGSTNSRTAALFPANSAATALTFPFSSETSRNGPKPQ